MKFNMAILNAKQIHASIFIFYFLLICDENSFRSKLENTILSIATKSLIELPDLSSSINELPCWYK